MDQLERDKNDLRELVWLSCGYRPTADQDAFHKHLGRLKLVAGGVRAGKSNCTAMDFAGECAVPNGLIWIVGPDYDQCKPEFMYLYNAFKALGWVVKESLPEKGSRTMTLDNGCRIQTKSSDDTRALASFAPHAILMVEAGQQTYEIYLKVIERALEHNARIILSGTFEGDLSWYAEMWEKWQGPNPEGGQSFSLPSWSNTFLFPGGRTDPKILAMETSMPAELFAERCGAIPYKPAGLVFRCFTPAVHVAELDFEPSWPVELAIDPAQHTYAVLAVQWKTLNLLGWWYYDQMKTGKYANADAVPPPTQFSAAELLVEYTRVRVIDEVYHHNITAQQIIPIVMMKPWWKHIKPSAGTIDIAGTHRQANYSQVQIWRELANVNLRSRYIFIEESINVVLLRLQSKDPLGVPLLQFSHKMRQDKNIEGRAMGTVAEMGLYRYPPWSEGRSISDKPVDSNNDGVKALAYWLFPKFGALLEKKRKTKKVIKRAYWK